MDNISHLSIGRSASGADPDPSDGPSGAASADGAVGPGPLEDAGRDTPAVATRRRRSDAIESRSAIMAAARELFRAGPDFATAEVARRAGVGQATLYRHFPDRWALVGALVIEDFDDLERAAGAGGDGFSELLGALALFGARSHHLLVALRSGDVPADLKQSLRERFEGLFSAPLARAQDAGTIRADLTVDDLVLVASMVSGAVTKPVQADREATARHAVGLLLAGLVPR